MTSLKRNNFQTQRCLVCLKKRGISLKKYCLEREILFRVVKDNRGNQRPQIVVPNNLRAEILKLCHSGISYHHRNRKTKRHYFWTNLIRDTENYVRTWDACQRIEKGRGVKKAPLKLVPIISEVFSRINCNFVVPVPESEKGNKYILTAICMASKYLEAIPLPDTKSATVIDGLILIFDRLG